MAYSLLSASEDSQLQIENTVFDPWLVECAGARPRDKNNWLYLWGGQHIQGPVQIKPVLFQSEL